VRQAFIHQLKPLAYAGEEAMNSICTNLTFAGRDLKKIILTSNEMSEGKSWMSMNIAVNIASRGRRVLLIDADLRRSFLVQRHRIELEGEGLGRAHFLTGQCELDDCTYSTNVAGLFILPAGRDVTNPVALIDTPYFTEVLDAVAAHFDLVLIDAPPVGMVIDAAEIASSCDGSVLVIEYNKTRLRDIAECKRQMERSGTKVLGCIINKVSMDTISAKKYYNRGYYRKSQKDYRREPDQAAQNT